MKILHVTAHMGGGAGNALASLVIYEKANNQECEHRILMLEKPINNRYIDSCLEYGISVYLAENQDVALEITQADIVILHWWNHPSMSSFLASFPRTKCRVILWSHVNGCNYPCLPYEFLSLVNRVLFTTPFSYENTLWTNDQRASLRGVSAVIYGLGDYGRLLSNSISKTRESKKFNIGYIGTLSKNKLHPSFIEYCFNVCTKVPNAFFIMVGDEAQKKELLAEANEYQIADRFEFTGYSNQIESELSRFDVFAYPLNPEHFGTTENVLIEAMACGIPVVALNHNTEKYIIGNDQRIGLLASSKSEYGDCIKRLHDNADLRKNIARNAKAYIQENFTFSKNIIRLRDVIKSVMLEPKEFFIFNGVIGQKPYEWFLTFLGKEKYFFSQSIFNSSSVDRKKNEEQVKKCSLILRGNNKSSILHFAKCFPDDKFLKYWESLISE